jgi:hypothetical protein
MVPIVVSLTPSTLLLPEVRDHGLAHRRIISMPASCDGAHLLLAPIWKCHSRKT